MCDIKNKGRSSLHTMMDNKVQRYLISQVSEKFSLKKSSQGDGSRSLFPIIAKININPKNVKL